MPELLHGHYLADPLDFVGAVENSAEDAAWAAVDEVRKVIKLEHIAPAIHYKLAVSQLELLLLAVLIFHLLILDLIQLRLFTPHMEEYRIIPPRTFPSHPTAANLLPASPTTLATPIRSSQPIGSSMVWR